MRSPNNPNRSNASRTMFRSARTVGSSTSGPSGSDVIVGSGGPTNGSATHTTRLGTSYASSKPRKKTPTPPRPAPHAARSPGTAPARMTSKQCSRWSSRARGTVVYGKYGSPVAVVAAPPDSRDVFTCWTSRGRWRAGL